MTDRILRAIITGSSAAAVRAFEETALAADAAGKKIGTVADGATSKMGGAFSKIGSLVESSLGIPVSNATSAMGKHFDEASTKGKGLFGTLSGIGGASMLAVGAGFAVVAGESIKMGASFQSSMELIHTQAGASEAEVKKMSSAVLALAGPTATAPNELAAGLYHLESAGMRGRAALDALKVAAEGAKVGHANLEDVTNALNAAIASGIPGVQNLHQAMGALNAIVGAGDMRMQDLAQAMGTGVVAAVKGYGLSLNDVGSALAVFGDNNIRGADGASQLRQAVMAMAKPAATAKVALGEIGMTTTQLAKDMSSGGLNKAITDLHANLVASGRAGTDMGAILTNAFGKKAGVGINVLVDQFDRFEQKTVAIKQGAGSFGDSWNATTKTLSFQMQQAKATVEALGTKFGMFLIPKLESLMKVGEKVVAFFMKHKAIAEALAIVVGGVLVAAITAVTISMTLAAAAFVAANLPLILISAAVALVAVGAYELVKNWGAVSGFFKKIWEDVRKFFMDAIHDVTDVVKGWYPIILGILSGGILLIPALIFKYWSQISGFVSRIVGDVVGFFTALPGEIVGALGDVVGTVFGAFKSAASWIDTNVLQPVISWFSGLPGRIAGGFGDIFGVALRGWISIATWVDSNLLQPVIRFFTGLPGRIADGFGDIWGTVFRRWMNIAQWVDTNLIQPFLSAWTNLPGKIVNVIGDLGSIGKDIINGIIGGVDAGIDFVNNHIPKVLGVQIFPSLPDIPKLAEGGIVTRPTLAMIGEAGPEAVVPLSGNRSPVGSGQVINVNVQSNADPAAIATEVGWALRGIG